MSDIPTFAYADLWEERQILSVANLTREDGTSFFEVAAQSALHTVTETFPLEQANVALDRLRSGALTGAAVLIPPRAGAATGAHG
jgi:propanol-preferring alcohol dehydrogenase